MRNRILAASAILIASPALAAEGEDQVTASAAAAQPPLTEAERAQAIQELQDLRSRLTALENWLGVAPPPAVQVSP